MNKLIVLLAIALIGLSGCCCPCAKKMHSGQPAETQPEMTENQE